MGEDKPIAVVIGIVVAKGGQHLTGSEGRASTRGACRAADVNGLMLGEGSRGPEDVVAFMLAGAWSEIEDSPPEEGTDDRLLKWGNDVGVNGGVHEPVFDGVEAVGEDIIVSCDAHIARYCGWRLIRLSGW